MCGLNHRNISFIHPSSQVLPSLLEEKKYISRNNLICFAPFFFFFLMKALPRRRQDRERDLLIANQNEFDSVGMEYCPL